MCLVLFLVVPALFLSGCDEQVIPISIPDTDTLSELSCADSQVAMWNGTISLWVCSEKSNGTGGGDITGVTTNGKYLSGGALSGQVDLLLNETVLNATIGNISDARDDVGSGSDGNNYTTSIVFTGTSTKTLTLARYGMENSNLTASFSDTDTDCNDATCNITNTGTLDGYEAADLVDKFVTEINLTVATSTGDMSGYNGSKALCDAEFDDMHLCSMAEIIYYVQNYDYSGLSGSVWVLSGSPKYSPATVPVNDCNGLTHGVAGTYLGTFWNFGANNLGGVGVCAHCGNTAKLACCK